jgi:hypothetical protein
MKSVSGSGRWWRACVVSALALVFIAAVVVVALPAREATAPTTVSITFDDALSETTPYQNRVRRRMSSQVRVERYLLYQLGRGGDAWLLRPR